MSMVYAVHGILSNGDHNVDLLLPYLNKCGHRTFGVNQKRRYAITSAWYAQTDANELSAMTDDKDVLVAHSYGCLKACLAAMHRAYHAVFLFAPAMEKDWEFSGATPAERFHCVYTPHDKPVRLGSWIPFGHPFGTAGIEGFDDIPLEQQWCVREVKDHSGFFFEDQRKRWAQYVHEHIEVTGPSDGGGYCYA